MTKPNKNLKIYFFWSSILSGFSIILFYTILLKSKKIPVEVEHEPEISQQKLVLKERPQNLAQTTPSPFYQKCSILLHEGSWKNVTIDETHHENPAGTSDYTRHENISLAGWGNYYWAGPKTCGYKIYQPEEVRECFLENYPEIIILGDSRSRQYWSALKPILETTPEHKSHFRMFDSSLTMPKKNAFYRAVHIFGQKSQMARGLEAQMPRCPEAQMPRSPDAQKP